MGLFGDFFGKNDPASAENMPAAGPTDPANDPNMVRVFDSYGREMFITREDWVEKVLSGAIKKDWDDAGRLSSVIIQSLRDKFFEEMVKPAERLREIDPDKERSATLLGVVYLNVKRIKDAERVFTEHIRTHGESGTVVTNLAKVYAAQRDEKKSLETLWHGLELDPNQDNGVAWYEAIHRERDGAEAGAEALRRIAALPGSWRAELWLARTALQARELERALEYYGESLSHAGRPAPVDLLTQMSGDLGNNGHVPELITLTEPHFDATLHGLQVGNNLIRAHVDLGQIDEARRIVDGLYALKRPDWNKTLSYWDTEIAKIRVSTEPVEREGPLQLMMPHIAGPVWLKTQSAAGELFPAKHEGGVVICFLGGSAEIAGSGEGVQRQMSDAPGRMSRALPLFLAEQVYFGTEAHVVTLVPWIADKLPGFVLSGKRWDDDAAAGYARADEVKGDYVVISHLDAKREAWKVTLRLVRTIDGKCMGELMATFAHKQPERAIPELARQLIAQAAEVAEIGREPVSEYYDVPAGTQFPFYLLHLEQLLAARCGMMEGVPKSFLSGERGIINGSIQLCLSNPKNVASRVMLMQTFKAVRAIRPEIVPEFRDKLLLLQKEKALGEPAQSILQRLLSEALGQGG